VKVAGFVPSEPWQDEPKNGVLLIFLDFIPILFFSTYFADENHCRYFWENINIILTKAIFCWDFAFSR